jgi:hypothetical protein
MTCTVLPVESTFILAGEKTGVFCWMISEAWVWVARNL